MTTPTAATILDLREAARPQVAEALRKSSDAPLYATAWQITSGIVPVDRPGELFVCVPDFLHYGRLLSTGQAGRLLQLPEAKLPLLAAGIRSGMHLAVNPRRLLAKEFWLVAECLMLYDVTLLGRRAPGATLMLHPYLTDFALAFQRLDFLARFARTARSNGRPWGLHTAQFAAAASALARLGESPSALIVHTGPDARDFDFLRDHVTQRTPLTGTRIIADSTSLPQDIAPSPALAAAGVAAQLILPRRDNR